MNRWYLPITEEEYVRWKSWLPEGHRPCGELPPELEREMRASWERIFDLELLSESEWAAGGQRVQAVLERIEVADVVSVKEFERGKGTRVPSCVFAGKFCSGIEAFLAEVQ